MGVSLLLPQNFCRIQLSTTFWLKWVSFWDIIFNSRFTSTKWKLWEQTYGLGMALCTFWMTHLTQYLTGALSSTTNSKPLYTTIPSVVNNAYIFLSHYASFQSEIGLQECNKWMLSVFLPCSWRCVAKGTSALLAKVSTLPELLHVYTGLKISWACWCDSVWLRNHSTKEQPGKGEPRNKKLTDIYSDYISLASFAEWCQPVNVTETGKKCFWMEQNKKKL